MANTIEYNIKINDGQAIRSIADIESELTDLNSEIKKVDKNSEAFKKAAQNIQTLQGELTKATDAVTGLTSEDKIRGFQGSIDILGGSVAGLVGGIGLLGIESENFDKFTAYAANAIAFSSGLRTAAQGAVDLGTSIQKAGGMATVFGNVTKKALISTGIGALVVAVGLLIAYWDDLVKAVKGASAEMKVYEAIEQDVIKAQADFGAKVLESQGAIDAAKKGIISKEQALKTYNDELGDSVGYADSLNQAEELMSKNSAIILQQIRLRTQAQALYAKSAEMAAKAAAGEDIDPSFWQTVGNGLLSFGNSTVFAMKQMESTAKNIGENAIAVESLATQGDSLTQQAMQLQNELVKGAKSPKQKEEEKKDYSEKLKQFDELKKRAKELADARALLGLSEIEVAKELAKREYDVKVQGFKDGSQAMLDAKALFDAEIKRIDDEAAAEVELKKQEALDLQTQLDEAKISTVAEERAFELEQLNAHYDALLLLAAEYGISAEEVNAARANQITQTNKKYREEDFQNEQAILEAKKSAQMSFYGAVAGVFGALGGLLKEGTAASKIAAIAEIAIGTGIGFIQGLDIAQKSAKATGPGAAFAFPIFYATQIAAVLAAAAKAKAILTKVPGGGGGGSGGSAPSSNTPSAAAMVNPFVDNSPTGISPEAQGGGTAVRAYVIAGDVTSSQEANAKLSSRREID